MTVLWNSGTSGVAGGVNHGLSYRETILSDAHKWTITVQEPGFADPSVQPVSKKVHKGVTLWQLIETNKTNPWTRESFTNQLWAPTIVSTTSPDTDGNICCDWEAGQTCQTDPTGSEEQSGQQPDGQQSGGQHASGQQPSGQQPGNQQSGQQQPGNQQPGGQQPNNQQPGNNQQPSGQVRNGGSRRL